MCGLSDPVLAMCGLQRPRMRYKFGVTQAQSYGSHSRKRRQNFDLEDGAWLRRGSDHIHINVAELEAIVKGLNLRLKWRYRKFRIITDSGYSDFAKDSLMTLKCAATQIVLKISHLYIFLSYRFVNLY